MAKKKTRSRKSSTTRRPVILTTGDYIRDVNIYAGSKPTPASDVEPGSQIKSEDGSVFLIRGLLSRTANSLTQQDVEHKKETEFTDPLPYFDVNLGISEEQLDRARQSNLLSSYAIWKPHPKTKDENDKHNLVWRAVQPPPGYGTAVQGQASKESTNYACLADDKCVLEPSAELKKPCKVLVIDDASLIIRHCSHNPCRKLWPAFLDPQSKGNRNVPKRIVLKMSYPVAQGDLWEQLVQRFADRLTVIVSIEDIRRMEVGVSRRISWERSALDLIQELTAHPTLQRLLTCHNVVVNFRSEGALWVERKGNTKRFRLFFDPSRMEREFEEEMPGQSFGYQSCLAAAIAYWLTMEFAPAESTASGFPKDKGRQDDWSGSPISRGTCAGLRAMRTLLKEGHGPVRTGTEGGVTPGFPFDAVAKSITEQGSGYGMVEVPARLAHRKNTALARNWTILSELLTYPRDPSTSAENHDNSPMFGMGLLIARYGLRAFGRIPTAKFEKLVAIDRDEIESLRNLKRLVKDYEGEKVQEKPLSIAVFGAPGSGKSFGVKQISKALLTSDVPIIEFNLSQFRNPNELVDAFHQVRDKVLEGITPVVFWDEFDSRQYQWLQYLLAPMQDGAFQDGQITHPIGKCVFVFAGGTSRTLERFGPPNPSEVTYPRGEKGDDQRKQDEQAYAEFCLKKGPDFVSRLHGFMNVVGPNPRCVYHMRNREWIRDTKHPDMAYPLRRALMIRGALRMPLTEELDIDQSLLVALLHIDEFYHGARSLEKIVLSLKRKDSSVLQRSSLLPQALLDRELNAEEFRDFMDQRNAFRTHPDIEQLAAQIHEHYRITCQANGTKIDEAADKDYVYLSSEMKETNRMAAKRMPEILGLINLCVVSKQATRLSCSPLSTEELKALLKQPAILDLLAEAEHLLWSLQKEATGWKYGPVRDNAKKLHPALVDWFILSPHDRHKDREQILNYPELLKLAGHVACRPG